LCSPYFNIAVSKWENGGMPDTELLPPIADFFGVSVDRLFGRKINDYSDLRAEVANHIASFEQESRFREAMEYCWIIEKALCGYTMIEASLQDLFNDWGADNPYHHSQILYDSGIGLFSLTKNMPYYFLLLEPEKGFESGLFPKEDYISLFKLLGDPDIMNSLFVLYKRENKPFTPKLLETKLQIPPEKAIQILDTLMHYGLISISEVELDDAIQKVYNFNPNPAFVAMLAIAQEMIKRPNSFSFYMGSRNKSYL